MAQYSHRESPYEVVVQRDVIVIARDGVRLATDLYFPARDGAALPGRWPALLHRTPYDKVQVERNLGYADYFARRGYVGIIQDCRGTFASEGEVAFLEPEAEDGADTMAWIEEQPWSDGKVGTWGASWSGWTQTALAAMGPANLASMIPAVSGSLAHESSVRQGGALELRFLAWAFWHSGTNTQKELKADPRVDAALNLGAPNLHDWLQRMPIRQGQTQLAQVPAYERWALKILTESDFSDYWRHPSVAPALHWDRFPDVPVLLIGGWYDSYTRGTFDNFIGLSTRQKSPVRVLMGPWVHGYATLESDVAGDVEFGRDAALDSVRDVHEEWFDWTLRDARLDLTGRAPLRLFVMGGGGGHRTNNGRLFHGGRWRDEWEWPLARTEFRSYYFHAGAELRAEPPEAEDASTTYAFNPTNPVPSIGGNVSSLRALGPLPAGVGDSRWADRQSRYEEIMAAGGFDQVESERVWGCRPPYLPVGSRRDVLVFETPPLAADLEVTGPIEVYLWVSSTAVDTDFTAKLIDVYPPSSWYPRGYALNISDSIQRLRYRNGRTTAEFLPPGEVDEIRIVLYPTSNLFAAGHRIRVDVSSSNFPRFDVNPNTGEPIGTERRTAVADNTIYHCRPRPSRIVLPVISATEPLHQGVS